MSKRRVGITLGGCFLALAVFVRAESRKAGLWEMTTNQVLLAAGAPAGSDPVRGKHTSLVCLTQQQLDKEGSILPHIQGCTLTNFDRKANRLTADMLCNGSLKGKATVESTTIDSEHARGKLHFAGSTNGKPVELTIESTSVFKGEKCGDVKPNPLL